MHGEVSSSGAAKPNDENSSISASHCHRPATVELHRRLRQIRRWCGIGFVLIPFLQAFMWAQYTSIVSSDGELLYADEYCGCRAAVARWVDDYFWTQMIWLPANTLALLIWGALAFKLWGKRFGPR